MTKEAGSDRAGSNDDRSLAHEPFVARVRRATEELNADIAPEREAALVHRVLSATTRRAAPLLSFDGFRGALRRSGLAQLVAASVVLHLGALGVVAMLAVREARAPVALKIRPAVADEPLFAPAPAEPDLESPLDLETRTARAAANRRRLDRFLLVRAAGSLWPGHDEGAPYAGPVEASEARLDAILSRDWQAARNGRLPTGFDERGLLATAMELDAWLFGQATDAALERLRELDRYPAEHRATVERLRDRARAYGLLKGEPKAPRHPLQDVDGDFVPIDAK
ncbi:MAG: hypothetical protein WD226_02065 [Planctomycetota bacterium]